jgi:hypothetical protein
MWFEIFELVQLWEFEIEVCSNKQIAKAFSEKKSRWTEFAMSQANGFRPAHLACSGRAQEKKVWQAGPACQGT